MYGLGLGRGNSGAGGPLRRDRGLAGHCRPRVQLRLCQPGSGDCQAILWFHNACGALALGDNAYGSGWGTDMLYAALYAMESCLEMTGNCKVVRWVCTSNALPE
ncbi:MAG: DUF4189 domain-containing protein [Thermodesulfobacteriota bacterium]